MTNIHAEAEITGPALEFLEIMASLDMSQHINMPHMRGEPYSRSGIFDRARGESGLGVTDLASDPLSWLEDHLIKFSLSMSLPSCRETGPIKMACPHRLLDPITFQDVMGVIPADLLGAPVEAHVTRWYTEVTQVADTVPPKCPLQCQAFPAP